MRSREEPGLRVEILWARYGLVFFKYPLMTLKVIFGIHFHALFLYLKKVKFEPHPKNKVDDISFSD